MPDPRSREWASAAAAEVVKNLNATEGRAFVLSTSLAGMQSLFTTLEPEIDYPCLVQGSASKGQIAGEVSRNSKRRIVCDIEFLARR